MDVIGSQTDYSQDPRFTEAVAHKVYYGPVYFPRPVGPHNPGEPYMTLSVAGRRDDAGVSVAEVGLKLIQDTVAGIKVGERGVVYVVDAQGRVIAHPDISLITADFSSLAQVQAARGTGSAAPPGVTSPRSPPTVAPSPVSRIRWLRPEIGRERSGSCTEEHMVTSFVRVSLFSWLRSAHALRAARFV